MLITSLIIFSLVVDLGVINPITTNWLMDGDGALHFLGWQFFRYTPIIQWPIGANPSYGIDFVSSSIVYSDSVPIIAIVLKYFNSFLPVNFQYSGLWLLFSFLMQGFFSWRILSLFTNNKFLPILGSIFFIIAPVFLFRIQFHYALSAHWLILYAIYLYLENKNVLRHWVFLLVISFLIMPYLFMMLIPIWLAYLLKIRKLFTLPDKYLMSHIFIASLVIYIVAAASGLFMISDGTGGGGYGFFKANLLTFLDPGVFGEPLWSKILPDIVNGGGDYEGMAFLGLGMIILIPISLYFLLRNFNSRKISLHNFYVGPLIFSLVLLFIYAVSNNIYFGEYQVAHIPLPDFINNLASKMRTGGRFVWPIYYGCYVATFAVIFYYFKTSRAIALLVVVLFIQLYDSTNAFKHHKEKFSRLLLIESPMKSKIWNEFPKHYDQVVWVALPRSGYTDWMFISEYAGINKMGTNAAHLGRTDYTKMALFNHRLEQLILNNNFRDKSLYIFQDEALWNVARIRATKNDLVGTLNGYKIFAPHYFNCDSCSNNLDDIKDAGDSVLYKYNMQKIDFTSSSIKNPYLIYGWNTPQEDGSFTIQNEAYIYVEFEKNIGSSKKLQMKLNASTIGFSSALIESQRVNIYVNDTHIKSVTFHAANGFSEKNILIPVDSLNTLNKGFLINFVFEDAMAPVDLGLHNDSRPHGINVNNLQLEWIN